LHRGGGLAEAALTNRVQRRRVSRPKVSGGFFVFKGACHPGIGKAERQVMVTILRDDGAEVYETKGGHHGYAHAPAPSLMPMRFRPISTSWMSAAARCSRRITNIPAAIPAGTPPSSIRRSAISCFGRDVWIEAYNERGEIILGFIAAR
jgi:hypothetical protein